MAQSLVRSAFAALSFLALAAPGLAQSKRVQVTGEIVDTWCNVSGLMFGLGTAHHQCAVWCTLGGIPVSIRDKDGKMYLPPGQGRTGRVRPVRTGGQLAAAAA